MHQLSATETNGQGGCPLICRERRSNDQREAAVWQKESIKRMSKYKTVVGPFGPGSRLAGTWQLRQMVKGVPTYIGQPPPSLKEYSLKYSLVFSAILSFFYLK